MNLFSHLPYSGGRPILYFPTALSSFNSKICKYLPTFTLLNGMVKTEVNCVGPGADTRHTNSFFQQAVNRFKLS